MNNKTKQAIEEYQCHGCVCGSTIDCYLQGEQLECIRHVPGTTIMNIGKIFIGMPKGFNRLGFYNDMKISIFNKFDKTIYDMYNIPVWKYKDKLKNILVRGLMPRINHPFIHVFLEDCLHLIKCKEIKQEDMEQMD